MIKCELTDRAYQIDSLDGLRGVAVLIVVFSHTSNTNMLFFPLMDLSGIGKSGVYLFFLLSAFLLTLPLLDKGKKIVSVSVLSHYLQRRFFRIYPLYSIYLLFAIGCTWFLPTINISSNNAIPFSLDWSGLWSHLTLQSGKDITWSIAVEFKFYFLLPIIAYSLVLLLAKGIWAVVMSFLTLVIALQFISPAYASEANDIRLLPYLSIFLIGMFLAVIHHNYIKSPPDILHKNILRYLGFFGVAGVILMIPSVYSFLIHVIPANYFHKQFILYTVFWSFILLSAVNCKGILQKVLTSSILRFYGTISFSLYLLHYPIIKLFYRMEVTGYVAAWMVLFLTTGLAFMSFKMIERPMSVYSLKTLFKRSK